MNTGNDIAVQETGQRNAFTFYNNFNNNWIEIVIASNTQITSDVCQVGYILRYSNTFYKITRTDNTGIYVEKASRLTGGRKKYHMKKHRTQKRRAQKHRTHKHRARK